MPRKSPLLSRPPALPEAHTSALQSISAMPVTLRYQASLKIVSAVIRNGETVFTWHESEQSVASQQHIDPRSLTEDFFQVRTEREALNFLRDYGTFMEVLDEIPWREFQRWQSFAELVRERSSLAAVHHALLQGATPESLAATLDPSGDLRKAILALGGSLNTYFDWPLGMSPEMIKALDDDIDQAIFDNNPDAIRLFCDLHPTFTCEEVFRHECAEMGRLQRWFAVPPPNAYEIRWQQRSRDASSYSAQPDALVCLADPADIIPTLHIQASCSLHAIAATLYADRLAGVTVIRCKGCPTLFPAAGAKTFCSTRCKNRVRTQDFRNRKREKETKKEAAGRTRKSTLAIQAPRTPKKRRDGN